MKSEILQAVKEIDLKKTQHNNSQQLCIYALLNEEKKINLE